MCIETAEGVDCAPCPEGYTGDGVQCDDVDEVRFKIQIYYFLFMLMVSPNISSDMNNLNKNLLVIIHILLFMTFLSLSIHSFPV